MLDREIAFCREKVGQEGSSLYYALLFQQPASRAFWLGCFALAHEIKRASVSQFEAGLSQVKLGWWRNALVACRNQAPQHPIILAIGAEVVNALSDEQWAELIQSMVDSTEIGRSASIHDWNEGLRRSVRPWMAVWAAHLKVETAELAELEAFWIKSVQLTQLLRLAKYVDEGFQPLPVDWLSAHSVTAEQVKLRTHNSHTRALFEEAGEFLIREANKHWQATPVQYRLAARPVRALFRMRVAEFKAHKADGFQLLCEQKVLNPWRKFSTAWTTHVLRR